MVTMSLFFHQSFSLSACLSKRPALFLLNFFGLRLTLLSLIFLFLNVTGFAEPLGFFTGITQLHIDEPTPQQLRLDFDGDGPIEYTLTRPDNHTIELHFTDTRIALELLDNQNKVKLSPHPHVKQAQWTESPDSHQATLRLSGPNIARQRLLVIGAQPTVDLIPENYYPSSNTSPPEPHDQDASSHGTYTAKAFQPPEPTETNSWVPKATTNPSSIASLFARTEPSTDSAPALVASEIETLATGPTPNALQQAQQWVKHGQAQKAVQLLQQLTKNHPNDAMLHATLGELYLSLSNYNQAFSSFHLALTLSHSPTQQGLYLDRCAAALYQYSHSETAHQQLALLSQRYTSVAHRQFFTQFTLGLLAFQQGHHQQALSHLQLATELNPQSAEAPYYLGLSYEFSGNPKQARQYYQQALAVSPQLTDARQALQRMQQLKGS